MSFRGHLWTVAPLLRHRLRPTRFPEARPWETALEDPQVGMVRLSGWLREAPGSGEILVLVHGLAFPRALKVDRRVVEWLRART